ncbi:MAG: hypothetical protein QM768_22075 [Agriterribacter sp.]
MRIAALLFFIPVIFSSCKKEEASSLQITSVLKQHDWYVYSVNTKQFDDISNLLLSDTSYIAEDCLQKSLFSFREDSVFERTMHCNFTPPYKDKGNWHLSADSMLTSIIWYTPPPASGYGTLNLGFGVTKLLEISNAQLVFRRTEISYNLDGSRFRYETVIFCKSN